MTEPIRPKSPVKLDKELAVSKPAIKKSEDISQEILKYITSTSEDFKSLKDYPIRQLVQDAQVFGPELKRQKLETNQIRKFLDAINRLKAKFGQDDQEIEHSDMTETEKENARFAKVKDEIILLKPKLAYAAARQDAVKSLSKVMSAAIDKVYTKEDFDRLVQLIESIIAYHKAEDGK
ncbi:type III-A CRISPR-associated protein Csm2 [Nostoc sp. JL33]|uniref:type III-A CRISPR-associated protein Csm2 n=1 Tax=Nostoc sp. JL33 TaxID=2815396 RepID=UPI0025DD4F38|nr:type III-A CRISPR-associated protein Csm2 [Nostoc sp. JL33]MBN3873711.1 type III-A CRISPR-associated protein Csm2 [Nostoc sp. JL33]